jgi:hypothetical protein
MDLTRYRIQVNGRPGVEATSAAEPTRKPRRGGFYKRGCQEKTLFPSAGVDAFF